jgi:hypothetical protein
MLHSAAKTGEGRETKVTVPYFELAKEVGFGEPTYGLNVRVTLKVEFIDDDGVTYETERDFALKGKICN